MEIAEPKQEYIPLNELEVYALCRQLSVMAWEIYETLGWDDKKTMGQQFIRSVDSIGANIAEGYGRFHYLDKIRFYYQSRGSYFEARRHWLELLLERRKIDAATHLRFIEKSKVFEIKLNNFISATYRSKRELQND